MSKQKPSQPDASTSTNAFRNDALREAVSAWKKSGSARPQHAAAQPPRARPKRPAAPAPAAGDEALFLAAMEDVTALDPRPSPAGRATEPRVALVDEDAETLARLAELVATGEGLDLADTDEYREGLARGVDGSLLVRLRRGDFSVQAHLDLHGMAPDTAFAELERFLIESRRRGLRCVLVVHGRGLHSKDQTPVLKERLAVWLSRGRLSRMTLAFATARPIDGGAGAAYVLLRR